MFDIQRTMREAYDKARRVLFESNSAAVCDEMSPTCKSGRADDVNDAVTITMSLSNNTGHRDDCLSTCTCFLVSTLLALLCY